ncbi:ATP-binding cassette domain-containing protein [Streptomyces sp. NPDC101225]|uniref:ABC transporter permease subunit n=1 Tax=Streptomyces sp. NPDC101225 TaxID=3366135 RepID=UPI0038056B9F
MSLFIGFILTGLVSGAIYALMASGLVLSYTASGIFNFALGGIGFVSALTYFELHTGMGMSVIPAAVIAICIVGPLIGLALHRLMFNELSRSGEVAQIVATIGLLVALPSLALFVVEQLINAFHVGLTDPTNQYSVPGLGPSPARHWKLFAGVSVDSNQLITFVAAAIVAIGLWFLLRKTSLGLAMRATSDRRALAALRGIDPDRASAASWMLSCLLGGLAGVLAAPVLGLDAGSFTVLLVLSATAAVFGRLRSVPVTFGIGLLLGVIQNLVAGYADFAGGIPGFRSSFPVLLLFLGLLFFNRSRRRVAGSVAEDAPPPDYLADLPPWRRILPWVATLLVLLVWLFTFASDFWAGLAAQGLAFGLIFLSFVIVTGIGGMVSFAQATFVTAAALTTGALTTHGVPFGGAVLAGVLTAAVFGALVALPALRLGGRVLALSTLALAMIGDKLLFQLDWMTNNQLGWDLPTVAVAGVSLTDPRAMTVFLLLVAGIVSLGIINLERSSTGRAILAVRSAPAAAATHGISATRTKLVLFMSSAAVAGLGGVLAAMYNGRIINTDYPAFAGFFWLAVVVVQGVRRVGPALLAGLLVAMAPQVFSYVTDSPHIPNILFGVGGMVLAKYPDGAVSQFSEMRHRRRQRKRAQGVDTAETVPAPTTPVMKVTEPASASAVPGQPAEPAVLELRGIDAGYGQVPVLRGVDLVVRQGAVVALLGTNGAGKSTTVNVVTGQAAAVTGGRVIFDGTDVTAWPAHRRARAGLFTAPEARGVFPGLTVEENLGTWLRDADEIAQIYDRFPILAERRRGPAGVLSGGEQQLLTLAPVLVRPPKLIVADEPALGLAPRVVDQIFEVFGELRDRGVSLLLAEEKVHDVLAIADEVVCLATGRVTWSGPRQAADEPRLAEAYLGIEAEPPTNRNTVQA